LESWLRAAALAPFFAILWSVFAPTAISRTRRAAFGMMVVIGMYAAIELKFSASSADIMIIPETILRIGVVPAFLLFAVALPPVARWKLMMATIIGGGFAGAALILSALVSRMAAFESRPAQFTSQQPYQLPLWGIAAMGLTLAATSMFAMRQLSREVRGDEHGEILSSAR
jgi:hypothetical protein